MKIKKILISSCLVSLIACKGTNPESSSTLLSPSLLSSFPEPASVSNNLRVSLTDAPSRELKNVFDNVDHAELFVNYSGNTGRVIVGQNLGLVDLMSLRNGVLLPLEDLQLSGGVEIRSIRLVLKNDNNYSIKSDDSRCEMQTPSGQQSGIKIHLAEPFTIENEFVYSMVLDFDAEKSVVIKGNGDCLLKPVLKLLNVTRTAVAPPPSADTGSNTGTAPGGDSTADTGSDSGDTNIIDPPIYIDPITDGTDTNVGSDFEIPLDPIDEPPVISAP